MPRIRSLVVACTLFGVANGAAHAGSTLRASITPNGTQGDSTSMTPGVSQDGRYVVFASLASNLVTTGNNGNVQIYLKDLTTGGVQLISVDASGKAGNGNSGEPTISGDARYIAFSSDANNLVANDQNQLKDIFVYDRMQNSMVRIAANGVQPNGISHVPYISRDGKFVVFSSLASNLVSGDTNGFRDVFVYRTTDATLSRVILGMHGAQPNGDTFATGISADGKYIAYLSNATNIVSGDTNNVYDAFVFDTVNLIQTLVSVSSAGSQSNAATMSVSVNDDGRYAAFSTPANNLVTGDTNGKHDVFLRDLKNGTTKRISTGINGVEGNSYSAYPLISGNGRYIAFWSSATNLVANGANTDGDLYVYDRIKLSLERLSVATDGSAGNAMTNRYVAMTYNGLLATFDTLASNLVPNDTNRFGDVMLRTRDAPPNSAPIADAGTAQSQQCNAGSASFRLDGSASSDADEDPLSYTWTGEFGTATGVNPTVILPMGKHVATLNVDDGNGGNAQSNVALNVVDSLAPSLTANSAVLEATSALGAAHTLVYQAADACGTVTVTANPQLSVFPLGDTRVDITATDASGNATTQSSTIRVRDTTPPQINAPSDVNVPATGAMTTVDIGLATADDFFPVVITHNAPAAFSPGVTVVTWRATDGSGNFSTAQQRVTVADNTPPVLTIPGDFTVEANGILSTVNLGIASALDAVDGVTIATHDAPILFPLGETIVTWSSVDSQGNRATQQQKVTVVDTTAPQLTLPMDVNLEATAVLTPSTQVVLGKATATDIFPVTTINNDAPTAYPLGTTVVTWSAQDTNKNIGHGRQLVTLRDTTAPVISAPANVITEATGPLTAVALGVATARDIFDVKISNDAPAIGFGVGLSNITWTATDSSGNRATATQQVTVQDTTAPALTVPGDLTVEANAVNSIVNLGLAQATDLVDGIVQTANDAPVGFALGTTTVTYTASDKHQNIARATQRVTVVDTTPPVITLPSDIVTEATDVLTAISIGQANAKDIFGVTLVNDAPRAYPLGMTKVTWTATDANGNARSAVQKVTVMDTTAPTYRFDVIKSTLHEHHHKMVHVATVSAVRDAVDNAPRVTIDVTVSPASRKNGRDTHESDWTVKKVSGAWEIWVRAENSHEKRKDRVYTINLTVSDSTGNSATDSKQVTVKHDHGRDGELHNRERDK